jgi:hypothetical protein
MALAARRTEAEDFMQENAVLGDRIEHLQSDVVEVKGRLGKVEDKVDAVKDSVAALRTELAVAIGSVRAEIGAVRLEFTTAIGAVRAELNAVRAEIKQANLTLVMWMIGTMLTLATLAFGIGRYIAPPAVSAVSSQASATSNSSSLATMALHPEPLSE